jgi:HEPN domain-containing protein
MGDAGVTRGVEDTAVERRAKLLEELERVRGVLATDPREVLAPLREGLVELDTYHTTTRYPDAAAGARPEGLPGGRHAERALETAPRCWEVVRDLVG